MRLPSPQSQTEDAVVLIGHGAPATDCPPQLVGELMALEWSQEGPGSTHRLTGRIAELDVAIRNWPRHAGNDPYKAGLEQVADALKPMLPTALFAIGYNEFCRPSIGEAIEQVIQQGAKRIFVIPSMLTPGGLHSEQDIPRALDAVKRRSPRASAELAGGVATSPTREGGADEQAEDSTEAGKQQNQHRDVQADRGGRCPIRCRPRAPVRARRQGWTGVGRNRLHGRR